MLDTNILVSAALSSTGKPYLAYLKAVTYPNQAYICEQNVDELYRVFRRKFPNKIPNLDKFFVRAAMYLTILKVPTEENIVEGKIRDVADRAIFRTALTNEIDIFVTGDKDFLDEAHNIKTPKIMTKSDFVERYKIT